MPVNQRRRLKDRFWAFAQRGNCVGLREMIRLSSRAKRFGARWFKTALNQGLRIATINDHADAVQLLLANNANMDKAAQRMNRSPLPLGHLAAAHCWSPDSDVLRVLLAAKAPIYGHANGFFSSHLGSYTDSALHAATQGGNANSVRVLLQVKADVNDVGARDEQPIHRATSVQVARLLLAAKAYPAQSFAQ